MGMRSEIAVENNAVSCDKRRRKREDLNRWIWMRDLIGIMARRFINGATKSLLSCPHSQKWSLPLFRTFYPLVLRPSKGDTQYGVEWSMLEGLASRPRWRWAMHMYHCMTKFVGSGFFFQSFVSFVVQGSLIYYNLVAYSYIKDSRMRVALHRLPSCRLYGYY